MPQHKIAIIEGVRTPMHKAGSSYMKHIGADDLAVFCVRELLRRTEISIKDIDEVIFGNVGQPANAANISRVIALKSGLDSSVPAYTVHRNCASGMESITTACSKIENGEIEIALAGGTESMSNIPFLYGKEMTDFFSKMFAAKTVWQKLSVLFSFRIKHLKPVIGLLEGLTDPVCGLMMGNTAEVLAREFKISREQQDSFALLSHQRALQAQKKQIFVDEITPITSPYNFSQWITEDNGPRANQTMKALQKLRPYFDKIDGTVTVGNACPVTDGAAAVLLMSDKKARELQLKPLGYLRGYAYAGLEPHRMGLGPVYATKKLLDKTKGRMKDFDLIELNEAFAAQVIANEKAFDSISFAKKYLNSSAAVGGFSRNILNVNGGAIALGHPVGMTGTRLVIHLLKELRRRKKNKGLATLCVGGGQGAALDLEVAA